MNWSNEKTLNFINDIYLRPELWNVEAIDYKEKDKKKNSWTYISEKYEISCNEAYKKFKSLRTYVNSEQRKIEKKTISSGGSKVKSSWFAFNAMSFVLSRDVPDKGMDSQDVQNNATQVTLQTDGRGPRLAENNIAETIKNEENVNTEEVDYCLTPSKKKRKLDVKLRNSEPILLARARQIIKNMKQRNIYSSFGEHIAQKLCSYDKRTRVEVEFKISQLLYEADIKVLRPTPSYNNYSSGYSDVVSPNKELYTVSCSAVSERTHIQPQFSNYSPNADRTDTNTQAENIPRSVDRIGIKVEYTDQ
ncbi:uncharacterized protein LOC143913197 [Arctopsyche grandis]|uniref:uncharacterized protein LOC143913197 n=1 Tax=Arctopsyche grandis TaxID=121162 RepID=UPI00406D93D4